MALQWYINGNTLVSYNSAEFGFSDKEISVTPTVRHVDVHADDFGHDEPAEVLWMLGEARIRMQLVYWDRSVLDAAVVNSFGGNPIAGTFAGAGTIMRPLLKSLQISSGTANKPFLFPQAYLAERPFELPLANERSILVLNWRCVALGSESPADPSSEGTVLWS